MPLGKNDLGEIADILENRGVPQFFAKVILDYIRKLSKFVSVTNVLLFGSVARGEAIINKSDIDLIVIAREFSNRKKIFELKRNIRGKLPGGIDSIWMGQEEFEGALVGLSGAILDALYEGIILYDEDGFLKKMRERLLKAIEEGEIERYKNYWHFPKVKPGERTEIKI
ncbi:MAG: nucleotidyltransferase domain-containing protein [Candidatus Njordarchaeia archaeon]